MDSIYEDMTEAEMQVANYLKQLGVWWIYQSPIFVYDDKDRPRLWTPDFYIPRLGICIEVWGSKYRDYDFRKKVYELNQVPVIFIHFFKRGYKWKSYLRNKIREIHRKRDFEVEKYSITKTIRAHLEFNRRFFHKS